MAKNIENTEEIKEVKEKKSFEEKAGKVLDKVKKPATIAVKVMLGVGITVVGVIAAMALAESIKPKLEDDSVDIETHEDGSFTVTEHVPNTEEE